MAPVELLRLDLGEGVHLELIQIPAGEFWMGSPLTEPGSADHEGPRHCVRFTRPFFMGLTPVTWGQFLAVMRDSASQFGLADPEVVMRDSLRRATAGDSWLESLTRGIAGLSGVRPPTPTGEQLRGFPVVRLLYEQMDEFCRRVSDVTGHDVRLPAEAQWEYACRAGIDLPFSYGRTLDTADAAIGSLDAVWPSHPVRSFPPNGWGLYDMHGLVHEVCADDWHSYAADTQTDPLPRRSDDDASNRVTRGGCFSSQAAACRSAARGSGSANRADTGFRVIAIPPR